MRSRLSSACDVQKLISAQTRTRRISKENYRTEDAFIIRNLFHQKATFSFGRQTGRSQSSTKSGSSPDKPRTKRNIAQARDSEYGGLATRDPVRTFRVRLGKVGDGQSHSKSQQSDRHNQKSMTVFLPVSRLRKARCPAV